jgi:hypothetical protein
MFSVPVLGERSPSPATDLRYVADWFGWAGQWLHGSSQIGLRIGGDEDSPDPALWVLAEIVLPNLAAVEAASDAYLRGFMGDGDGFYTGSWRLQSLEVTWPAAAPRSAAWEFQVTLAIGNDDYGEWRVGFRHHTNPTNELVPFFFSRKQW